MILLTIWIISVLEITIRFSPDLVCISNSLSYNDPSTWDLDKYSLRSFMLIKFNSLDVQPINSSLVYPVKFEKLLLTSTHLPFLSLNVIAAGFEWKTFKNFTRLSFNA